MTPSYKFLLFIALIGASLARQTIDAQPYTWTKIAGASGVAANIDGTNGDIRFFWPFHIATDRDDNLYIAESGQWSGGIRKLSHVGTNWVATTVSRIFNDPKGVAVDEAGNIFVADTYNIAVRKLAPRGTNWDMTTIADATSIIGMPYSVAVDRLGMCILEMLGTLLFS